LDKKKKKQKKACPITKSTKSRLHKRLDRKTKETQKKAPPPVFLNFIITAYKSVCLFVFLSFINKKAAKLITAISEITKLN